MTEESKHFKPRQDFSINRDVLQNENCNFREGASPMGHNH